MTPKGRPPVDNPATRVIQVRVTPDEKNRTQQAAKKMRTNVSEYIRRLVVVENARLLGKD